VYGVVDDGDRLGIVEEFMRSGSLRRLLNLHVREARESLSLFSSAAEDEKPNGNGESKKNAPPPRGKRHLSLSVRARCALDVARGMAYLHSRRFVHFDLKCDNVLTARQLGVAGGVTCKVADFGLSKQQRVSSVVGSGVADAEARQFTSGIASQRGTLPWTAPELFSDPANATESVDAYSFGVCMWELWTCDVPFKDMREQSVVWGIMTGKRPELPPADLDEPCVGWRDLMTALWREDPKSRPTFDETVRVLEEALTETNAENGARRG
jgi:serine/threonine protein kinase